MYYAIGHAQIRGSRAEQQDAFACIDLSNHSFVHHGGAVAVVTDGMGGLAEGRRASSLAAKTFMQRYAEKQPEESIPEALLNALTAANSRVCELAREIYTEGSAGSTLVAAAALANQFHVISVGDSAIYHYRHNEQRLVLCNPSHNYQLYLEELVKRGEVSTLEAKTHPKRGALISYLGLATIPRIYQTSEGQLLLPGDRLLLCSDGVSGRLSAEELLPLLPGDPAQAANHIIRAVEQKMALSQDNATAVVIAGDHSPGKPQKRLPEWLNRAFGGRD